MKSGSFQTMNLNKPLLKAIYKKGYRNPTPIQRKTIPHVLENKDVVAMARTGSGKTAAFLIPIIEKLKNHKFERSARALIISPTRELALQTYKFARELSVFTDLKCATILGGDSMENQFGKIHDSPDIIIATPGRLLHLAVEMDLKFSSVEMIVFDEADRLFELGFKEQLNEILSRLSRRRQTLLFSATLPQTIVDFTKAGLVNPVLIRLDTEKTISENLKLIHLSCRNEDKLAALLYLLKTINKSNQQTIVFMPSRHHIEYVKEILDRCSISSTYLYSSLDPEARKTNIRSFHLKKINVLLVTDLAARGVDIPLLDNVINFNFPSKSKLFVHRVGRTARAGRCGTAYSLISNDELPYLFSLSLFLNSPFKIADSILNNENVDVDAIYGTIPQSIIDEENEIIEKLHIQNCDLDSIEKVCNSAYKQYLKTRIAPDGESVRKVKSMTDKQIGYHPIFISLFSEESIDNETPNDKLLPKLDLKMENQRVEMLGSIKTFKPNSTIFELGRTKDNAAREVMKMKRLANDKLIYKKNSQTNLDGKDFKDKQFYLNYQAAEHHFEKGLQLDKSFHSQLKDAILDFDGDESGNIMKNKNQLKWDRKKKKFTNEDEPKVKKIKTESGNWISASYKSGLYEKWQNKTKHKFKRPTNANNNNNNGNDNLIKQNNKKIEMKQSKTNGRKVKNELKTKDEIFKERQRLERVKTHQRKKFIERKQRAKRSKNGKNGKANIKKQNKMKNRKKK